jgi:hypothetical protein
MGNGDLFPIVIQLEPEAKCTRLFSLSKVRFRCAVMKTHPQMFQTAEFQLNVSLMFSIFLSLLLNAYSRVSVPGLGVAHKWKCLSGAMHCGKEGGFRTVSKALLNPFTRCNSYLSEVDQINRALG